MATMNCIKRIRKELKDFNENPPENCAAGPISEENIQKCDDSSGAEDLTL